MKTKKANIMISRRFQFCSGHRVMGHESKCAHMHGHNYIARVTVIAPQLDSKGRVIDFSVVKDRVGNWIDSNWDHGTILHEDDHEFIEFLSNVEIAQISPSRTGTVYIKQKLFLMPSNPTAENMASHLLDVANGLLPQVAVTKVQLWETENCDATVLMDPKSVDAKLRRISVGQ